MRAGELTFGQALRKERLARQWTLRTAAKRTGVAFAHLGRIERDEVPPGDKALVAILAVFGQCRFKCPTCGGAL